MSDLFSRFVDWLKKPYSDEMDAFHWFAFVGLLLIIGWLWSTILRKISVDA